MAAGLIFMGLVVAMFFVAAWIITLLPERVIARLCYFEDDEE